MPQAARDTQGPELRSVPGGVGCQGTMCWCLPSPLPLCLSPCPGAAWPPAPPLKRVLEDSLPLDKVPLFLAAAAKHRHSQQTRSVYIQLLLGIASFLMVIKERGKNPFFFFFSNRKTNKWTLDGVKGKVLGGPCGVQQSFQMSSVAVLVSGLLEWMLCRGRSDCNLRLPPEGSLASLVAIPVAAEPVSVCAPPSTLKWARNQDF